MMNHFRERVPNCVDRREPPREFEFNTLAELLSCEWVHRWTQDKDFYKFSLNKDLLIVELKNGKEKWVVGYIKFPDQLNLPQWRKPDAV